MQGGRHERRKSADHEQVILQWRMHLALNPTMWQCRDAEVTASTCRVRGIPSQTDCSLFKAPDAFFPKTTQVLVVENRAAGEKKWSSFVYPPISKGQQVKRREWDVTG